MNFPENYFYCKVALELLNISKDNSNAIVRDKIFEQMLN